ncbi:hypothetical protein [Paenibacillus elgii]|uniref:hypothetical protein n=1 Tax=Paenibacillus elgii TaxID=189691 RepID=UPI0013D13F1F|nr:hypothetical protein [Paenibacillus elgii]
MKITVSKLVADAIEKAMGHAYFRGDKEKFLQQHSSTLLDPWGPSLSALNGLPYEDLERALNEGYELDYSSMTVDEIWEILGREGFQLHSNE